MFLHPRECAREIKSAAMSFGEPLQNQTSRDDLV